MPVTYSRPVGSYSQRRSDFSVQKDVPVYGEWVATLDGYVNAQIQPQVTGYIINQDYKEGSVVAKGQVLYEIDPRPF
jgi:multidrug efflux pump subunit AcrA (membrane-fusion protein)